MNLLQATYEILVTLSVCDGEYDDAEGRTILDFLQDNHDGSFDFHASNKRIMGFDKAALDAHFNVLADFVADHSTPEDREAILEFGLDLVMSDGELSEEENVLARRLSARWDVALQPIVARTLT